jgi:hypothetical protein
MRRLPSIPTALNQLFPTPWLQRAAKDTGAFKRQRKIEVVLLFWCLMLVPQAAASLAAFQRRFRIAGGAKVARSAFLRRFSTGLVAFLGACLDRAIETTVKPLATPALFRSFKDVWAQDSSLVSLSDALAAIFPGPRNKTTPAAVKINAVASVLTGSLKRLVIAEGTRAETKFLSLDSALEGVLLLFDLGYFSYAAFARIDDVGGFFVSRMKAGTNPRIVADRHSGPGRTRKLVGMKLRGAVRYLGRGELDVEVEVTFSVPRRPTKKDKRKTVQLRRRFRVVGVRHPQSGELHLYMTNIAAEIMRPEQVRVAYSARWAVELIFAELKGSFHLEVMPSRKPEVVRALVLGAALRLMVSRVALDSLRHRLVRESRRQHSPALGAWFEQMLVNRTGHRRFARVWTELSLMFLPEVLRTAGFDWDSNGLELLLVAFMLDPNPERNSLFLRLARA